MPEPAVKAARPLTLGIVGHIDHGKTALVKALTNTDTDRLAEERRRGISIELGFAELTLPNGQNLSVVDVPGHERLVRTMVAGATGMDLFLMTLAADDGVMPQTREHAAVLRALGIDRGLIALTKVDRVDEEARLRATQEAQALFPDAPLIATSARTGEGLDRLRGELARLVAELEPVQIASEEAPAVLHIDRVFTLRGIGTVVTGTLRSGTISKGQQVEILPRGIMARVRSVEVHGCDRNSAIAGSRTALALSGVDRSALSRGDVIASPGSGLAPSYRLDVELRLEHTCGDIAGERVQVHQGTRDAPARVVQLSDDGLAQLRLETPLIARANERFVLRGISPPDTIGGGVVLDPTPARHGPGPMVDRLRRIREHGLETVVESERQREHKADDTSRSRPVQHRALDRRALVVLGLLDRDGAEPRSPQAIEEALRMKRVDVLEALDRLIAAKRVVRLTPTIYYSAEELAQLRHRAIDLAKERGEITIAELRDALGTTRKYSQAVLEHLDATKLTVRQDDRHVLRRMR